MDYVRRGRPGYPPAAGSIRNYKEVFASEHMFVRIYKVEEPVPFGLVPDAGHSLI